MPALRDQAVCIRHWDWSETSQTVSLFCREHGLVRGIAKGSKRATSTFSGGIELLHKGELFFILKPNAELALLTRWDLQETFPALRADLTAHYAGLYMADLVQHFARDHDPHPRLFDSLLTGLRSLSATPAGTTRALLLLQWSALLEAGYRPVLDRLLPGDQPLPSTPHFVFDPHLGGLVDPSDAPSHDGAARSARADTAHDWRLRPATVALLRELSVSGELPDAPAESIERAARFLAAYIRSVLGSEPNTLRLVFPDLARS